VVPPGPLWLGLVAATPALTWRRRLAALLLGTALLAAFHVLYFAWNVHLEYALANLGPYEVTDLSFAAGTATLWDTLGNPAQLAKLMIGFGYGPLVSVARRVAPIVIWLLRCGRFLVAERAR